MNNEHLSISELNKLIEHLGGSDMARLIANGGSSTIQIQINIYPVAGNQEIKSTVTEPAKKLKLRPFPGKEEYEGALYYDEKWINLKGIQWRIIRELFRWSKQPLSMIHLITASKTEKTVVTHGSFISALHKLRVKVDKELGLKDMIMNVREFGYQLNPQYL